MKPAILRIGGVVLLLLAAALHTGRAAEDSSKLILFKIESKEGKPGYLFGTLHLPRPEVVSRLDHLGPAFDDADTVFTEIDMNPESLAEMTSVMFLPGNETLGDHLPPALMTRLQSELQAISPALGLQQFSRMKPWALHMMLAIIEDQLEYPNRLPLDLVLYNRARDQGKSVGGLETIDEQVAIFGDLTSEEQVELLEGMLDLMAKYREEGKSMLDEMAEVYLAGDLDAISEIFSTTMPSDDNALNQKITERLLTRRNELMAERIEEQMTANPDQQFLFAVGAGHLFGDEGVPALLEKAGLTVTPFQPEPEPTP